MKPVFADTAFWIAFFDRTEPLHGKAVHALGKLKRRGIVTTDLVLSEFLNFVCDQRAEIRAAAATMVEGLGRDPHLTSVAHDHAAFLAAVDFYRRRADKTYSLTDCLSMLVMRERGLQQVLTTDSHFGQEGFTLLLDA